MTIDPYILTFSALTVIATVWMGFWAARKSKTASDFYVAGRSVSVGWNASAISGEYLSAASFMGVAGMVMSSGYDALWYPVCYACGYLFLLLFIAGPLRRFGAYTIPDFAEGRYDSTVFRKIAVVFVLFIGFFYTMPQMKGAGTTLAYIFPGLPYWAGVVLVGAVITLNVALGGMKGITLVQAFQYWAKMFAISVPIFVLMAVYGHYGNQLGLNSSNQTMSAGFQFSTNYSQVPAGFLQVSLPSSRRPTLFEEAKLTVEAAVNGQKYGMTTYVVDALTNSLFQYGQYIAHTEVLVASELTSVKLPPFSLSSHTLREVSTQFRRMLETNGISILHTRSGRDWVVPGAKLGELQATLRSQVASSKLLPAKAPTDATWLNPFGPLTTKAAKAAKPSLRYDGPMVGEPLNALGTSVGDAIRSTVSRIAGAPIPRFTGMSGTVDVRKALQMFVPEMAQHIGPVTKLRLEIATSIRDRELASLLPVETNVIGGVVYYFYKPADIESALRKEGITILREAGNVFKAFPTKDAVLVPVDTKPYALLYTYSLIIALVCGTAGLPHILVRFYTNPDGVAAKRTTMWVMILIGVFYLFPPIFGVMGRNLLPELYAGTGAKGTDKVVLELPRILNQSSERAEGQASERRSVGASERAESERSPRSDAAHARTFPWGSILSGITCAGAFAAFMSTFSGLLVSMTGALAHDVYGRMLRPKSTPEQRMRAFRICAVIVGAVAILLGMQVEPFQINFMVGQAFAIAAASYFPLLFMSAWWRGMTMKGAATGMLTGGTLALLGISLTSFSDLKWLPIDAFWATHPLVRILCEQPAIWTVPLAITLMIVVSKLTAKEIPADIRMKMLVLHAPEKLGLKQEYIQEHQHGH